MSSKYSTGRSGARRVLGWDIGGANVKVAHVEAAADARRVRVVSRPFEIWRAKETLPDVLQALAAEVPPADAMAVTMTAELSDAFRTKREGVGFVLDAVSQVPGGPPWVFTTAGEFLDLAAARARPLAVAAANWMATARLVARRLPDALLVDVGSTTTDLIPIQGGRVAARGRTDPERLLAGELVYTGAVRTNVAAVMSSVPLWAGRCPVASELFATSGDAHLLLGDLTPDDYAGPTADGRPPTTEFAAERLARVVCADVEMLAPEDIRAIAAAVSEAQCEAIAGAMRTVASRLPGLVEVIMTGLGAFLARRAADRAGLLCRDLAEVLAVDVGTAAPAVAVAWLWLDAATPRLGEPPGGGPAERGPTDQ
jgi:probable H4MPT-linked C1 transfer pathway protein